MTGSVKLGLDLDFIAHNQIQWKVGTDEQKSVRTIKDSIIWHYGFKERLFVFSDRFRRA